VKDVIVFPKRKHIVLHRWKINLRGYIAVCHLFSSSLAVNYHAPPFGSREFKGRDDF
jgi:hypothetical protein